MKNISDILKEKAIALGLCEQWNKEWSDNTSIHDLLTKYKKGIDFCIKHDYPKLEDIETLFADKKDTLKLYNIFYNDKVMLSNPESDVISLGKCLIDISADKWSFEVYARHDSEVNIRMSGRAVIWVNVLDNAKVNVVCTDSSKAYIHNYSANSTVTHEGNVSYKERIGFFDK